MSKTVFAIIEHDCGKTRPVEARREVPGGFAPVPGQKRRLLTFRLTDVPEDVTPEQVLVFLAAELSRQTEPPGRFGMAYNIPWPRLEAGGIVSRAGTLTLEEAAAEADRSLDTVRRAVSQGSLAVSRTVGPDGRSRQSVDRADLAAYMAVRKPPRGRHFRVPPRPPDTSPSRQLTPGRPPGALRVPSWPRDDLQAPSSARVHVTGRSGALRGGISVPTSPGPGPVFALNLPQQAV